MVGERNDKDPRRLGPVDELVGETLQEQPSFAPHEFLTALRVLTDPLERVFHCARESILYVM